MQIERTAHGLALRGELDATSAPQFEEALREALVTSTGDFVIDLCDLSFMDSGGVNELLRARSLLGREERALALVCPSGVVRRVLDLIGITELFTLFATREEAERALTRVGD